MKHFWIYQQTIGLPAGRLERIRTILEKLNAAAHPAALQCPGFRYHRLTGRMRHRYSVDVSANYRITFAWAGRHAVAIDYLDTH